jgi:hypothetical protein
MLCHEPFTSSVELFDYSIDIFKTLLTLRETATLPSIKNTRQSLCRVLHSAKDTRKRKYRQRRLCRVHFVGHSAKPLPSAKSRTRQNLSAVTEQAHNGRFAECRVLGTRQRNHLCRVPRIWHSVKIISLPSVNTRQRFLDFAECRHSAKILQILPSANTRQSAQNYPF